MVIFILLVLGVVFASIILTGQNNTSIVMCSSFGCAYNKRARCTRKEISIYDNTVKGLCLFHSETMANRIFEPMKKGIAIERGKANPQMIDRIMKAQEDSRDAELIKNPEAFARWIKKQKGIL